MKSEILILSHGKICTELIDSAAMLVGFIEGATAIPLMPGMDPETYCVAVEEKIKCMPQGSLVLVDIFGGTPFNTAMSLSRKYDFEVLTGVNMTMLIEADNFRSALCGASLAQAVQKAASAACINVKELMK